MSETHEFYLDLFEMISYTCPPEDTMVQNLADIVVFGIHQDHRSCSQGTVDFAFVCLDKQSFSTMEQNVH